MKDILSTFWRDDSGPELVEWAVVVVLLLVASVVFLILLRDELILAIRNVFLQMQTAPTRDYGP